MDAPMPVPLDQAHQVQLYIQQQVQQQVQAALQQLPAPVAAPQPQQAGQQARFGSRSLPAPGTYSGATGGALEVYEREMKQRFEYYAVPDDGSRVRDAQMFLRGHALTWFSNLAAAPVTFAAYMTALRAMFEPLNSADTARHQLDKLQQQPKQSVHDYIAAFRMLLARVPDMSEQDRLHRFKAGLRKDLCMEVMRQGAANLEAAVGIAARYGTIGLVYGPAGAATVDSAAPMDLSNTELGESAPESVQGDAVAQIQELRGQVHTLLAAMRDNRRPQGGRPFNGAGGRRLPVVQGLTPEQVRACLDAGQCFVCRSTDHHSRQCPKKGTGSSSGPAAGSASSSRGQGKY
jgi:hypothetical protein